MSWWGATWPALAEGLLLVLPGWGGLWLSGVRGVLALVAAPAVSAAGLGAAAAIAPAVGFHWSYGTLALAVVLGWTVALAVGRWRHWRERDAVAFAPHTVPTTLFSLATFGAAAVVLAMPIKAGMVEPHALSQTWDSVFHLNGIQAVRETGNASPLGGMAPLYGDGTAAIYYPTLWHSIVALTPSASIPLAANASTFVFGVAVWLSGLYGFARAALPSTPAAAVLTPLVASSFVAFPTVTLSTSGQWPNGAAVALIPGAAALIVVVARQHLDLAAWGLAAAAVLGVAMAHGSGVFAMVIIAGAPVLVLAWRTGRRAWRAGRRRSTLALVAAACVVVVGAAVVLARGGLLDGVLNYPRAANGTTAQGVVEGLLDIPMVSEIPGNAFAATAAVFGSMAVFARREGRWLVPAWLALVIIVGLATGPENPLRWLSGFWYKSAPRIAALVPIPATPLGAVGLWAVGRWIAVAVVRHRRQQRRDRWRFGVAVAITASLVIIGWGASGSFRTEERTARFAAAYVPDQIRYGTLVSAGEIELIRSAENFLPEDAVVVGDPFNGAAYLWSVSGIDVVFPQLGSSGMSADQRMLRQRFSHLHDDPAVCAVLERVGATHFYEDEPAIIEATDVAASFPGMYGVDTSRAFTEVARADTARVYEITACG